MSEGQSKPAGQLMREMWGPSIDRFADEIADPRDAQRWSLVYENERLRKALQHCIDAIASWEKKPDGADPWLLGALDNARAELQEKSK